MSIPGTDWDDTFEKTPQGTEDPSLGDDRIVQLKAAIRQRICREHYGQTSDTQSKHGLHRPGSAIGFYGDYSSSWPIYRPEPGSISLGSDDAGRIAFDSTTLGPRLWNGTEWVRFMRSISRVTIQGVLGIGTNIVPAILFAGPCQIVSIAARVGTAPTTNGILIDVNKRTGGSIFSSSSNRLTIEAGEYSGSRTSAQMSLTELDAGDWLQLDIDQVGGSTKGSDLSIAIEVFL